MKALSKIKLHKLNKIYHDPNDSGSYGGVWKFWKSAKAQIPSLKYSQAKEFLKGIDPYTLHKNTRKHYKRRRIVTKHIDEQWEADLVDMSEYAKYNENTNFILTVLDAFSKFAWAIPVKRKDSASMLEAFKKLFQLSNPRKPKRIHTDKGKEFFNATVQNYLKEQGIELFATESDMKAAIAERFNRTLKSKMWRYFTAKNTFIWIDIVNDLVTSYNNTVHRAIGLKPIEVVKANEHETWKKLYGQGKRLPLHSVGSHVRISKQRRVFDKGYLPGWTTEVFKIKATVPGAIPTYQLVDEAGEDIKGSFYSPEIQSISHDSTRFYDIEKIVQTKIDPKSNEKIYLVKFFGLPPKFNSWVKDGELFRYPRK